MNQEQPHRTGRADAEGGVGSWIWDLLRTWGPPILLVLLVRAFVVEPFRIPSGSMVPTLLIGDHVVVTKFSYGIRIPFLNTEVIDLGEPERGDIIVFRYPRDPRINYIKRVVATPGDRVAVENNQLVINGEPQAQQPLDAFDFVNADCRVHPMDRFRESLNGHSYEVLTSQGLGGRLSDVAEREVPEDKVFVVGDNRDHSEDSRAWSFVDYDAIRGKAHRIWLSWDGCTDGVGRIRTERLMHSLYDPSS